MDKNYKKKERNKKVTEVKTYSVPINGEDSNENMNINTDIPLKLSKAFGE